MRVGAKALKRAARPKPRHPKKKNNQHNKLLKRRITSQGEEDA
jgi:hypothetical protein